jgi:hypothetical protein
MGEIFLTDRVVTLPPLQLLDFFVVPIVSMLS